MKRAWLYAAFLIVALSLPAVSLAAAKTYQVTGPVLEVTDKTITVQKGKDKWEIERTADLKVEGELKVGEKITITYHMVADAVEVKGDKKDDKKTDKK